jgi:hypothetical protein
MQTIHLLVRGGALPPIEELYELTANDVIESHIADDRVVGYEVVWPEVRVRMRLREAAAAQPLLAEVQAFAQAALGGRADAKARKNLRRVLLADTVIDVEIDPAPDAANKARDLVLGVLAYYSDGLLWGGGALYNENGKRFIGAEDAPVRYFPDLTPEDSAEALQRKERSLAVLRREKVPFIPHLPVIADSTQATPPTVEQIVERFIALVAIAERAEGATLAEYEAMLAARGAASAATPDEIAYARSDNRLEQDTIKFSQRLESAWVLAWALGLVDALKRPDEFCQVEALREWASIGANPLKRRVKLRPLSAILDMADLHYRYHWAVNDAELYGTRVPARLIPAVAYERHYALNWLISAVPWDTVSTDT